MQRDDEVLENRAWERAKSKDTSFSEKPSVRVVSTAMKVKVKPGSGFRRRGGTN